MDAARRLRALWALGCVALMLSGAAHWLLVRHAVCAVHGELEHANEAAALDGSAWRPAHEIAPAPGAADHDHEHCAAIGHERAQALRGAATRVLCDAGPGRSGDTPAARPACVTEVRRARPIAIYAIAPKSSPPRAG